MNKSTNQTRGFAAPSTISKRPAVSVTLKQSFLNNTVLAPLLLLNQKRVSVIVLALFCFLQTKAGNSWSTKTDFGGSARSGAVGFMIGTKGYIGTGGSGSKDFWEWDPSSNSWTQKADFGGGNRTGAVAFAIGSKGYVGTGSSDGYLANNQNDFWEYNPANNTWSQKANYSGGYVSGAVAFSTDDKGYIGCGAYLYGTTHFYNTFYEYDPSSDSWSQKAGFAGGSRAGSVGFSIGSKGYVGTGFDGQYLKKDFWEYNPSSDKWTQKADFGGSPRTGATGFSIGNKGYIGTGTDAFLSTTYSDFYEYNQRWNTWSKKTNYGFAIAYGVGFSNCTKGYIGTGTGNSVSSKLSKDFVEYAPSVTPGAALAASKNPICVGDCINFADSSTTIPTSWKWTFDGASIASSTAQNPSNVCYSTAGSFTVTLEATNQKCGASTTSQTIVVQSIPIVTVSPNTAKVCSGSSVTLTADGADSYSWSPGGGLDGSIGSTVSASPTATTKYTVSGTTSAGCTNTATVTVTVNQLPPVPTITKNGSSLISSSATGNQWFLDGNSISGATSQSFTIKQAGDYTVCVSNSDSCSSCSSVFTNSAIEKDMKEYSIKVYPNPSTGTFYVVLPKAGPQCEISLINILGIKVFNTLSVTGKTEIVIANQPKGTYFLEVKTRQSVYIQKVEIE